MPLIAAISVYVDDMEKAIVFYRDVLGFGVRARPVPFVTELEHEGTALILCKAERSSKLDYPNAAGTIIGIATDDVAKRATDLKGKAEFVVPSPQEFPGGKFVALRDPAGNVVELLQFDA